MRTPGDVAKAFAANSDIVMIGGMLAGTDEMEGDVISKFYLTGEYDVKNNKPLVEEKKFKVWFGMSSETAQEKYMAGMKEYRTSEGRTEEVPYIGPVQNVINDILGGLRSAGTYIGAKGMKQFGKCATLLRVTKQHNRF